MKCFKYSLLGASLVASLAALPLPAQSATITIATAVHQQSETSPSVDYRRGFYAGYGQGRQKGMLHGRRCIYRPYVRARGTGDFAAGYRSGYLRGYERGYRLHA